MAAILNATVASALMASAIASSCAQMNGERGSGTNLTPLMIAASKDDLRGVEKLISKDANVNERGSTGETALYEAIERRDLRKDNLPIVKALLDAGANPNQLSIYALSPLDLSLTRDYGNPNVTLLLIHSGAHVSQTCGEGDSEVSLAAQNGIAEVVAALIQNGAPVDCQYRGMRALDWASMNGFVDEVSALLNGGANPALVNSEGKTALDLAVCTNPDKRVQRRFAITRDLLRTAINKKTINSPRTNVTTKS